VSRPGRDRTVRRILAPNPGMMTGPGTNTYLVGVEELAVIDPGPDVVGHVEAVAAAGGGRIRWILVTHTHPDHSPAALSLARATGATCLGFASRDGFEAETAIGDGFVLEVDGMHLRAIHTPGHASNHLCYLLEEEGLLFSGDHVMDGSTVVISPPDGDMAAYMQSLARVRDDPLLRAIAPGHGELIADAKGRLDYYIAHRMEREHALIEALRRLRGATVADLVAAVYTDVPVALHPVAEHSVWAHLRKLAAEGHAVPTGDERLARWETAD
jgi:glyoxylase-like metal-dependent hydrolase (beta-lactamase superfamily II)